MVFWKNGDKKLTIETIITKKGKEQTKLTQFFLLHKENYIIPGKWEVGKNKSKRLEEVRQEAI
jgi:hypothetical protein